MMDQSLGEVFTSLIASGMDKLSYRLLAYSIIIGPIIIDAPCFIYIHCYSIGFMEPCADTHDVHISDGRYFNG